MRPRAAQQPHDEEEHAERRIDREREHQRVVALEALVLVGVAHRRDRTERDLADAGVVAAQPRHAQQQRVPPGPQQRRRELEVARHVPGAGQRFDEALVAAQQLPVYGDGAGHVEVLEQQARALHGLGLVPLHPVPHHAVEAAPALVPEIGDRDLPPNLRRAARRPASRCAPRRPGRSSPDPMVPRRARRRA
jgi:hypothetical protein